MRIEKDSLGEVPVPDERLWGAQTQRSLANFYIARQTMPLPVIYGLALAKKAAALVNADQGLLDKKLAETIAQVCDEILAGKWDDEFPLVIWQTGSGTQSNMNVNEVIANLASEKLGGKRGEKAPVHPNDHVNLSQSSNDVFPTAMHISAVLALKEQLLPALDLFHDTLATKSSEFKELIKIGRTHLMDAAPVSMGQSFSAFVSMIGDSKLAIKQSLSKLYELALGGTAVGTGLNSPKDFGEKVALKLSELSGQPFVSAPNKFAALSSHDAIAQSSAALRGLAGDLLKIANDIRFMGSGPRCGFAELKLPENEPGSSIMPGKVNPTQCEALSQVAIQVYGHDSAIAFAASQGQFELNVYKPLMIYNLLAAITLLSDAMMQFVKKCLKDIEVNQEQLASYVERSLMLATALNKEIGYDQASKVVRKAYQENSSLKQAALELNVLSEEQFDRIVDPKKMI